MIEERIKGKVHIEPSPALRQVFAASTLGGLLLGSFQLGVGGPGGWVILDRPAIRFGDDLIIPDLAGFRVERAPRPNDELIIKVIPDWVCEILSPRRDTSARVAKLMAYARDGVQHSWLLDPFERTLEVLTLGDENQWQMIDAVTAPMGRTRVRAPPFDTMDLDLNLLWPEEG